MITTRPDIQVYLPNSITVQDDKTFTDGIKREFAKRDIVPQYNYLNVDYFGTVKDTLSYFKDIFNSAPDNFFLIGVLGFYITKPLDEYEINTPLPIVTLGHIDQQIGINVETNHQAVIEKLVKQLHKDGFKKICFVDNRFNSPYSRYEYLKKYCAQYDIELLDQLYLNSKQKLLDYANNESQEIQTLFDAGCELFFCNTDYAAIDICNLINNSNLNVPNDISVIGYSNHPCAKLAGLTTVAQDINEICKKAVDEIIDLANKKSKAECRTVNIDASIIYRDTYKTQTDNTIVSSLDFHQRYNERLESLDFTYQLLESYTKTIVLKENMAKLLKLSNNQLKKEIRERVVAEEKITEMFKMVERLSEEDDLTGLYNHRFFINSLNAEFDRAARYGINFSIVIIDLDHFKNINDEHGHLGGDYVLQEFAKIIKSRLRTSDLACRYGGEEFALILPHTNLENACSISEELRAAIAKYEFIWNNAPIKLTISAGVAEVIDTEGTTPSSAINQADKALYKSKKAGRNRVTKAQIKNK